MRASRRSDRPVRHLDWRVRLFAAGALLALAGMFLRWDWLVNVALAVLVGGFLLRFVPERDEDDLSAGAEDDDEDDDTAADPGRPTAG